jgi:hypothetical protein
MCKRMIIRLFLISAFIAIIGSCAKISAPSGGRRDKTPPVVVKSMPLNGTKNFKGKKIEVVFDEYVVLDNINDKFMVSPPMKKKPKVFTKGKAVVVELEEKLKDSTTYTFYFLDAIRDLNEGNILPNFQFVLSTGPVIDSLSVTGNVYNANNLEIPEKTQVSLYRELADSAVQKHLPEYITRLDLTGYFRIDNIRPGIYKLYGLKDADNSKTYNTPDEEFAFMDSTITINSEKNYIPPPVIPKDTVVIKKPVGKNKTVVKDTTTIKKAPVPDLIGEYRLFLFGAKKKAHYLLSSKRDYKYHLNYILSLPPDSMGFEFSIPGTDKSAYMLEPSRNRDTLMVWLTDSALYSQPAISTNIKFPFTDSLGVVNYKLDTVVMRFASPRVSKSPSRAKKKGLSIESNIQSGNLKPGETIVFKSKTPFASPDTTHIRLYELAATNKISLPYQFVKDSIISTKYYLKSKIELGKKYFFLADSAAWGDIYKLRTDSIGIKFAIKDPESYGKITFTIKNYVGPRIIQLLDKSEKLIAEMPMKEDGKVTFSLLETGVYRARVIYDLNGDGKWTTGDFSKHRQPEPVSYYYQEMDLKPGWVLTDQPWDIGIKNFKDPKLREPKKTK